jgi:hypothetical protein
MAGFKLTTPQHRITALRQNDRRFMLTDGVMNCPRAGFEINQRCPEEYKYIISECISKGWLMPVAYVYDKQLTMDALR